MITQYVVELSEEQLRLVGKALHVILLDDPDNEIASSTLKVLVDQSNCVYADPHRHGVFRQDDVINPYDPRSLMRTIPPMTFSPYF